MNGSLRTLPEAETPLQNILLSKIFPTVKEVLNDQVDKMPTQWTSVYQLFSSVTPDPTQK